MASQALQGPLVMAHVSSVQTYPAGRLAALHALQPQQHPCQDAAAQHGAQHSGFLQDCSTPVKHPRVAAAAPGSASSVSSAHTCNSAYVQGAGHSPADHTHNS